ncbi:MAG: carbohydrate ABC transporter permease [Limnochordaceae bacterium]|nr:carbohydrate ABC transporter permease [Limnochordaceae bacterium]
MRRLLLGLSYLLFLAFVLGPLVWIFLTSIKSPVDVIASPPKLIFRPVWDNYKALFIGQKESIGYALARPDFPAYFRNSLIVATGAVLLSAGLALPTAYGLARFSMRQKENLAFTFLSFRFAPELVVILPLYVIYQRIGLYNTYVGLILVYQLVTLPFMIWILRGYFQDVPRELEEAAMVDGCSWLGALWRVALPLIRPGLAATVVLGFIFAWNSFVFSLILGERQTQTVTVGLLGFMSYEQVLWGQMAAAVVVTIGPELLLAFLVQRYIVRGLTFGALKS